LNQQKNISYFYYSKLVLGLLVNLC